MGHFAASWGTRCENKHNSNLPDCLRSTCLGGTIQLSSTNPTRCWNLLWDPLLERLPPWPHCGAPAPSLTLTSGPKWMCPTVVSDLEPLSAPQDRRSLRPPLYFSGFQRSTRIFVQRLLSLPLALVASGTVCSTPH